MQRAEYDRQLAKTAPRRKPVDSLAAVLPRATSRPRRAPAWVWGLGVGAVGASLLGLVLMQGSGQPDAAEPVQVAKVAVLAPGLAAPPAALTQGSPLPTLEPSRVASAPAVAPVRAARAVRVKAEEVEPAPEVASRRQSERPAPVVPMAQRGELEPVALAALEVATPALRVVDELKSVPRVALAASRPVSEPVRNPSLAEAQAAMGDLIQAMQGGQGEDVLRSLERGLRQSGGAIDLVNAYKVLIGDSRAVRLRTVRLRGRPDADQLVVDGTVQLVLNDQGQPPPVRELRLRAAFALRGGQVVMTEISTGGPRP